MQDASPPGNTAIDRFVGYCQRRIVAARTVIITAGAPSDTLYYLLDGSVEVLIEDENGNEMVLAYLGPGQFFGEMGLFQQPSQRTAWVRSRSVSSIAEMPYPRFLQLVAADPSILFALTTQLAARLDRTNRKLGDLVFVDVTGRIARALLDLAKEPDARTHPQGVQVRASRRELARLVGCSREMAGRVIRSLEEQGLIRTDGKLILVRSAKRSPVTH